MTHVTIILTEEQKRTLNRGRDYGATDADIGQPVVFDFEDASSAFLVLATTLRIETLDGDELLVYDEVLARCGRQTRLDRISCGDDITTSTDSYGIITLRPLFRTLERLSCDVSRFCELSRESSV